MGAYFSGSINTYLYCTAAAPATLPGTQSLTMMCWVKLGTNPSAARSILGAVGGGITVLGIQTNTNGLNPGIICGTSSFYGPYALPSNEWRHVCCTLSSPTTASHLCQLYVNGNQVLANQSNTSTFGNYSSFTCGSITTGFSVASLVGWVQDVRIFNRVLNVAEVRQEMNSQFPVRPGIFLNSEFKNDVRSDQSGLGHLWTLNGAGGTLQPGMQPKPVIRRSSRIFL
jgi:hypothetical protein